MGAATGPATPGSSDAPGDCTPRCRRPPRPRRTTRQQTTTEMSETSYGTAQAGAQTLAAGSLRDFRVPFVPHTLSASQIRTYDERVRNPTRALMAAGTPVFSTSRGPSFSDHFYQVVARSPDLATWPTEGLQPQARREPTVQQPAGSGDPRRTANLKSGSYF